MRPGHILAQIDWETERKDEEAEVKIYCTLQDTVSAPSMRKMHFSSFLVHWLWSKREESTVAMQDLFCFQSSLFWMCSPGRPRRLHRCSAQAKGKWMMKRWEEWCNDLVSNWDVYFCALDFQTLNRLLWVETHKDFENHPSPGYWYVKLFLIEE